MKKIILFSFIILLIIGCTKLGEPTMHPGEWVDQYAENSHIAKITVTGTEACKACHGNDGKGGISEVSCFQCHAGGPSGHLEYSIWVGSPDTPDFHGKDDIARCITCHGEEYLGGISEVSCYQCHDGPSGYGCPDFVAPATHTVSQDSDDCEALHMTGFEDPLNNGCTLCHGADLSGGISEVSCFVCHSNRWDGND